MQPHRQPNSNVPSITPPTIPNYQTQQNFLASTQKYVRDPHTLQPIQQVNSGDNFFSKTQTNVTLQSSVNSSPSNRSKREKIANKTHYSHARRAADEHSIIFEEDLDSEGELEKSTYYKQPVKNFSLKEDRLGSEMEESDDGATGQNRDNGRIQYDLGNTSNNFNDNSTLGHMQEINSNNLSN